MSEVRLVFGKLYMIGLCFNGCESELLIEFEMVLSDNEVSKIIVCSVPLFQVITSEIIKEIVTSVLKTAKTIGRTFTFNREDYEDCYYLFNISETEDLAIEVSPSDLIGIVNRAEYEKRTGQKVED